MSKSSQEMFSKKSMKIFDKRDLYDSKISILSKKESEKLLKKSEINNIPPYEKVDFPSDFHNPGVDFFEYPPLVLKRDYSYENPKSISPHDPDRTLFTFDKNKLENRDIKMNDAISCTPPLVSIFPTNDNPIFDPRIEISPFQKYMIGYFSLKFSGFMPDRFVEPIFVNVFLWDLNTKRKISETWRFFVEYPNIDPKIRENFNSIYENSPLEVVMPKPLNESQVYLVVYLDRLLYHHNGSSLNKYYEKPTNKLLLNQAKSDTSTCNHKGTTTTFAWSAKPFQEIVATGNDENKDFIKFQNFYFTQSVNDNYIANNLSQLFSTKKNDKGLQIFQVWFDKGEPKDDLPYLLQYFDIPRMPYMKYENTLIILPLEARFKFPRGYKGRNIFAEIRLFSKYDRSCVDTEKPLQLFNNGKSDVYITRYQYHVEHPYFNEEIIVHLPINLPTTFMLKVNFIHASLKKDSKQTRQLCGTAICPLANQDGAFIGDGVHSFGIWFTESPTEKLEPQDSNRFTFSVYLRSSIYPSSQTIASLFQGKVDLEHFDINEENLDFLIVHLYPVLDILIDKINDGEKDAFELLMKILSFYKSDRNKSEQSQALVIYLNRYAFRTFAKDKKEIHFNDNIIKFYHSFLENNSFTHLRSDFYSIWFIFELIIKASLLDPKSSLNLNDISKITSNLSHYLYEYRKSHQNVGQIINRSLALFYKDLLELPNIDKRIVFKMVEKHLSRFGRKLKEKEEGKDHDKQRDKINAEKTFDRKWFRDFFKCFVTPKVFTFLIMPCEISDKNKESQNQNDDKDSNTLFNSLFIPIIESEMNNYIHTDKMFQLIYRLLLKFDPDQYKYIAQQLIPLLFLVGRNKDLIMMYDSKPFQVYIFVICHFILYYGNFEDFTDELGDCCSLLIREAVHTNEKNLNLYMENKDNLDYLDDFSKFLIKSVSDTMNLPNPPLKGQFDSNTVNIPHQSTSVRKLTKHKKQYNTEAASKEEITLSTELNEELEKKKNEYLEIFDCLAFCIQTIMVNIFSTHQCVKSLNYIISNLLDVEISPLLLNILNSFLELLVKDYEKYFLDPNSDLKHIYRRLFQFMDEKRLKIIEDCSKKESQVRGNTILTDALIAHSLYKVGVSDELLEMVKESSFKQLASSLYRINKHLENKDLRENNYDVYSDLLFQKAELLTPSPDARVSLLLELTAYHTDKKYVSEAVISQITAAALVAEYLSHLKRIPRYFVCKNPATMFCIAAPSAVSEICPDERVKQLPNSRGFCTSKYFSEYGLLYLLINAVDTCKRAQLYEMLQKFHSVLTAIAEYRHLWQPMSRYYMTGSFSWEVINNNRTANDRSLGNYYRVQFMDGKVYIYRETKLANLWQVCERLKVSTQFISEGKEVVVINEGEELNPKNFEENKYYIHVKSVLQYFTSDERKKRVTVFEQNHNISQFYFDIPISKSAQSSIEHCSLKRTIFTIPHPLPYIVKRVEVPKENIKNIIFSPIEFSCQNLQKQIDLIEEACARNDFQALQPLIQGSLLVQVNEGPKKIAEVFLGSGVETNQTRELRNIFRKFIEANSHAVHLHAEYVKKNPVFSVLQDELDSGLNRLMSSLQPYLT